MSKRQRKGKKKKIDDSLFELTSLLRRIESDTGFSFDEIIKITREKMRKKELEVLPVSVFDNPVLSGLEVITKFLKEEKGLKFSEIARLLNRNDRTIWNAYSNAAKKYPTKLKTEGAEYFIPVSIFYNRKFSILEHISRHLKDVHGLSYRQIGQLLRRNERTIWTVYSRAKKK